MQLGTRRVAHGQGGAVSAAHPRAVAAALDVLAADGSAADAAIAAQAVIAVVMPEAAGVGGDMLALVRDGDRVLAVNGTGATAAANGEAAASGGASVTVPGAVGGWLEVHRRFGRIGLDAVLAASVGLARDGAPLDASVVSAVHSQRRRLLDGGAADWSLLGLRPGDRWRQPELASCLAAVAARGREAFYTGPAATAITDAVARTGGRLTVDDLAAQTCEVGPPLSTSWDGGRLWVQPPMSQGVLLAIAAHWLDGEPLPPAAESAAGDHLLVEATEAAFAYRDDCTLGSELLRVPLDVDRVRAGGRGGPRAYLHTAGVAVVDRRGQVVSSLVSVFDDFGSGVFVPELGLVLNNRAGGFTSGRNAAGPGRRPVHTLAPALLEHRDGSVLALATPGADGQVQTLLQVLWHLRRGSPLADALEAPRWRSQDGRLLIEQAHPARDALARRGHAVASHPDGDPVFGAVVAAGVVAGECVAAGDHRRHVAVGALPSPPRGAAAT